MLSLPRSFFVIFFRGFEFHGGLDNCNNPVPSGVNLYQI
jgi:hypothetical protein